MVSRSLVIALILWAGSVSGQALNGSTLRVTSLEGNMKANGSSLVTADTLELKADTLIADNELYVRDSTLLQIIAANAAETTPGGSDTQVQFNNAGVFGGSANLTWDGASLQVDNLNLNGSTINSTVSGDGGFPFSFTNTLSTGEVTTVFDLTNADTATFTYTSSIFGLTRQRIGVQSFRGTNFDVPTDVGYWQQQANQVEFISVGDNATEAAFVFNAYYPQTTAGTEVTTSDLFEVQNNGTIEYIIEDDGTQDFQANSLIDIGSLQVDNLTLNDNTITSSGGTVVVDDDLDVSDNELRNVGSGTAANGSFYETGTFTPVVADASSSGNTATGTLTGEFTRIGNKVHVELSLVNINTAGMTAGNDLWVTNLPFTSSATGAVVGSVSVQSISFTGYLVIRLLQSATAFRIAENTTSSNIDLLIVSDATSGSADIICAFDYITSDY